MKVLLFLMLSFKLFSFNPSQDEVSIDPSFGILINDLSYSRYKLSVKNLAFNRLGCYYLIENNLWDQKFCRFDVVGMIAEPEKLVWHKDAFRIWR